MTQKILGRTTSPDLIESSSEPIEQRKWGEDHVAPLKAYSRRMQSVQESLNAPIISLETAILGLKINVTKSELILVGRTENLDELALVLGLGGRKILQKIGTVEKTIYFQRRKTNVDYKDFLWGGGTLDSKPHLVKWDTICSDRRRGGLGVKRLHSLNKAFLWGWCSKEARGGYGVGLWKTIRKLDEPLNVSFPSLFALSNSKDAWVAEL
ncbi:hypothetical protein CK203_025207 [Vitis vinifera]|uniref:Uncharacterized protein n=1 Tax=Vitis vinifera TaxID=29760 RepID=A0A438JEU7_VITVI|nr:hypothetical protein CK203_025207 [Vitis vinifera]